MDDAKMQEGFARLENLIDNLATLCAREFKNISDRFADIDERFAKIDDRFAKVDERFVAVDERLAKIEGHIEAFGRRVDDEAEERHVLGERVSKLEKAI
jgi:DNA anti-recombination protein RmuC